MTISNKGFGEENICGLYPEVVNEELAYRVGRAFPQVFQAKKVVVGRDIRLSSEALQEALMKGLTEAGCEVIDLRLCGTEMISFAVKELQLDGGIMITAGTQPKEYNGMKLLNKEAVCITRGTGLELLEKAVAEDLSAPADEPGKVSIQDVTEDYVKHLLSYVDLKKLKPYKIVANTGNGAGGPMINAIEKPLPFDIVKVNNIADGNFPYGLPNPQLEENHEATASVVRQEKADLGLAWDVDFSHCVLFDENGAFVDAEKCFPEFFAHEGGMLPWLLVLAELSQSDGKSLSALAGKRTN